MGISTESRPIKASLVGNNIATTDNCVFAGAASVFKATVADANNIGEGFLTWHKTRKWRGSITVIGDVETKAGGRVPVEWLRAGQRYYVPQFNEVFFIRTCNINAETREATITPDLPPDDTSVIIDKLRTQANEAARLAKYNGAG